MYKQTILIFILFQIKTTEINFKTGIISLHLIIFVFLNLFFVLLPDINIFLFQISILFYTFRVTHKPTFKEPHILVQ